MMEENMNISKDNSSGDFIKVEFSAVDSLYLTTDSQIGTECSYPNNENIQEFEGSAQPEQNSDEFMNEEPSSSNQCKSLKWGIDETNYLLHLYSINVKNVGPLKQFRFKKAMWTYIASKINKKHKLACNGIQAETRYKCIIKRKKPAKHNNNTSESTREETEFDGEINNINYLDESFCPDYLLSPGKVAVKGIRFQENNPLNTPPPYDSLSSESDTSLYKPRSRQRKTLQERIFDKFMLKQQENIERQEELTRIKEENKERRHQEKMKILKDIFEAQKKNTE